MDIQPKRTDLMFCCSGAADTAEVGDRAVRALHNSGRATMFCLAGIAGRVELIQTNTRAAPSLLVVNGCDNDCARKTMELAGFTGFVHLRVTDLGFEKGKTGITDERIETVAAKLHEMLGQHP